MITLARFPTADTYTLVLRVCIRRLETRVPYSALEEEAATASRIAREVVEAMGEQGSELEMVAHCCPRACSTFRLVLQPGPVSPVQAN